MHPDAGLRNLVVGISEKVPLANGEWVTAINFDNAASTPPFKSVMQEIADFAPWYASIHRGTGYKSLLATEVYEKGREVIKRFVNADPARDILIYTKNTTESINLLSYVLAQAGGRQIVLATEMEHLANDLPWRNAFMVDYVSIGQHGKLALEDLEAKLKKYGGKVRLVAVTGASNVTGYKNPIYKIARLAHAHGAKILVDGAQLVPHCPVDMKDWDSPEHIDYLAFSAHKMYAPFGTGVLIGPRETFEGQAPMLKGGGAVQLVSPRFVEWDNSPYKEEAGTPNVMGAAALVAAIRTLEDIGMEAIAAAETSLIRYIINGLACIPDIKLYATDPAAPNSDDRIGIISFALSGVHHRLLAKILSYEAGISVRSGLFCAHPYVEKLLNLTEEDLAYYQKNENAPFPGLVRISLGLYNSYREADVLLDLLDRIARRKAFYIEKYSSLLAAAEPEAAAPAAASGPVKNGRKHLP